MQGPSRQEIWKMFDRISPTYDRVNRAMTFGVDRYWRKKMAKFLPKRDNLFLLDCATGTADQIISLLSHSTKISKAIGVDLAKDMLVIGKKKISGYPFAHQIELHEASALVLPYADQSFDCVTISFGIRNVTDVKACLRELYRVLKPQGRILILESSIPSHSLIKSAYLFYMRHLLTRIGGWISKDKEAYVYLNKTTETFFSKEQLCSFLQEAGFKQTKAHPLTFGVVTIYVGDKE